MATPHFQGGVDTHYAIDGDRDASLDEVLETLMSRPLRYMFLAAAWKTEGTSLVGNRLPHLTGTGLGNFDGCARDDRAAGVGNRTHDRTVKSLRAPDALRR